MSRPPTLSDVAHAAGVSLATASRVLSGGANVSGELRERVWAASGRLQYLSNPAGRALAIGARATVVQVMVGAAVHARQERLLGSIEYELGARGFRAVFAFVPRLDAAHARLGDEHRGCILVDGALVLTDACRARCPTVTVSSAFDPRTMVRSTRFTDCARLGMSYLRSLGRLRVGLLAAEDGLGESDWAIVRGLGFDWTSTFFTELATAAAGARAIEPMLAAGTLPDAMFCTTDALAAGTLTACARRGIDVPGTMSVLGCGDFAGDFTAPALSSLRWDTAKAGAAAVACLFAATGEHRLDSGYSSPKIVVRGSTAGACFT